MGIAMNRQRGTIQSRNTQAGRDAMKSSEAPAIQEPQQATPDPEPIPVHVRAVLLMFVFGFVLFSVILLGDLVVGFFR